MRASLWLLSIAIAFCAPHAAAVAQPGSRGVGLPGGLGPSGPGTGLIGPGGGSFAPIREPRVSDFINGTQGGNQPAPRPASIPPEVVAQLVNPPAPKFDHLQFVPPVVAPMPMAPPARPETFAAFSSLSWEWVGGIFVLGLLAMLMCRNLGRGATADPGRHDGLPGGPGASGSPGG